VGLSVDNAARKLQLIPATVEGWESGSVSPTIKQLRRAAAVYKRPLAILLLPTPPRDFDAMKDFRLAATSDLEQAWSPELHSEFRRSLSQREVFLELAELSPQSVAGADAVPFRTNRPIGAEAVGAQMRELLELDSIRSASWANPGEALNECITAAETLGMIVVQTKGIEPAEMRGFSISEWPFPVVALNGKDAPRARIFTLLHEICHIGLHAGGLCDLHERKMDAGPDDRLEHFCNEVAASVLMPAAPFLGLPAVQHAAADYRWSLDELYALSRRFGASSEAVLLRLVSLGKATWDLYWEREPELARAYEEARQRERERQRESGGGPSYYVVKARDLGHGYIASVLDAFQARAISSMDLADYLEVRFDQVPKLAAAVR
jgi:Zn-dependent peptidase ImmA (M78 family)/transcriptional regulator with XRE-family HTH domain